MKHHLFILGAIAVFFGSAAAAEQSDDFKALMARQDFVAGDYAAAIAKAQPLADAGQPRALTLLGLMHERGLGMTADPAKALEYYQKAADLGFPQAIQNLASCYRFGELGVTEDDVKARALFAQAAALELGQALSQLGEMLREGEGGPVDMPMAVALFERAVSMGDPDGTAEYAYMLATGDGAEIDLPRARKLYEIAAAHGIDWAERDFGEMLELAEGGPSDLVRAKEFYQRAVAQDYAMAGYDIAEMAWANPEPFPDKVEALAYCLWAESFPPMADGSDYDGKCVDASAALGADDVAKAKAMAESF